MREVNILQKFIKLLLNYLLYRISHLKKKRKCTILETPFPPHSHHPRVVLRLLAQRWRAYYPRRVLSNTSVQILLRACSSHQLLCFFMAKMKVRFNKWNLSYWKLLLRRMNNCLEHQVLSFLVSITWGLPAQRHQWPVWLALPSPPLFSVTSVEIYFVRSQERVWHFIDRLMKERQERGLGMWRAATLITSQNKIPLRMKMVINAACCTFNCLPSLASPSHYYSWTWHNIDVCTVAKHKTVIRRSNELVCFAFLT